MGAGPEDAEHHASRRFRQFKFGGACLLVAVTGVLLYWGLWIPAIWTASGVVLLLVAGDVDHDPR